MLIELVTNTAATLVAAFAGAWFAFRFESWRRAKEEIDRRIAAANRAMYTIFNLWNILSQFQKEAINPFRGKNDAWLNMPATLPSNYGLTSFQADELAFLLQTKHANTYSSLLLEEQRFWIATHQIEMRSAIIQNEVFPGFAAAGVPIGTGLTEQQIEKIIGNDIVHKLKQITKGITKNVDDNIKSLRSAHDQIRDTMNKLYPKRNIIRIDFDENK